MHGFSDSPMVSLRPAQGQLKGFDSPGIRL